MNKNSSVKLEKIIKRNERIENFDSDKIYRAILKAGKATKEFDESIAKTLTIRSINMAEKILKELPTVEDMQDIVEEVLLSSPFKLSAKAYIIYREQHAKIREIANKAGVDLIDQYLEKLDWQVKENSNMSFSLQGLHNYIASETNKIYWLNKIYPPNIRKAHIEGSFHIHDLGVLAGYCVGWDLKDLLTVGFQGVAGKVQSNAAKHFRAALGQIVNFFYTLQGEAAGAQAFSNIDTLLAPYIRYDKLSYEQVKQAMQEFIFNINVPTRVGFQTPFTNITLDLHPSSLYKDTNVLIGGEIKKETYGEFQEEMNMFNKAFLEVMQQGDAKGRIFTFPIPTYNITKDFNWDDPNLDLLWKVTGKYGIPYFTNFINSEMDPEDTRSMCCRLRLDTKQLKSRGGGLFGSNPLTGSIGVVTINLPRIGYLAKTEKEFINHLSDLMDLAKESLEIKRKIIENFTEKGLYPYSKFYLRQVKQRFNKYWTNHFSTIGLIGMNEASLNLLDTPISTEVGKNFAINVLDFMREKLNIYQDETDNNYNLEATPAEGTTYRLALIDKKRFPDIKCANEPQLKQGAKPFYTNSSHLPVNYTDDLFEALDHQDDLQKRYTGGTVLHAFLGEKVDDPTTIKNLIKKTFEKYELPYLTISPTFSVCAEHGYLDGEHQNCPKCSKTCEVYSRVVGYYRPVDQWNDGKRAEFDIREEYDCPSLKTLEKEVLC
ncbi:MAG: Anaerobic ribonucleoside-triphosphate reductase [Candidatus Anoxychlamydiales bacterium]|nr:Anaerobic ribonucleoside-triphosphate reductase [Candidatus Anoxychlamydiales bacterium]